jgi:hypothetical protein
MPTHQKRNGFPLTHSLTHSLALSGLKIRNFPTPNTQSHSFLLLPYYGFTVIYSAPDCPFLLYISDPLPLVHLAQTLAHPTISDFRYDIYPLFNLLIGRARPTNHKTGIGRCPIFSKILPHSTLGSGPPTHSSLTHALTHSLTHYLLYHASH